MGCGASSGENTATEPIKNQSANKKQPVTSKINPSQQQRKQRNQPMKQSGSPRKQIKSSPQKNLGKTSSQGSIKNISNISKKESSSSNQKVVTEGSKKITSVKNNPQKSEKSLSNSTAANGNYYSPSKIKLDIKEVDERPEYNQMRNTKDSGKQKKIIKTKKVQKDKKLSELIRIYEL